MRDTSRARSRSCRKERYAGRGAGGAVRARQKGRESGYVGVDHDTLLAFRPEIATARKTSNTAPVSPVHHHHIKRIFAVGHQQHQGRLKRPPNRCCNARESKFKRQPSELPFLSRWILYHRPPSGTRDSPEQHRPRHARHTLRGFRPARAKRSPSASCLPPEPRARPGSTAHPARESALEDRNRGWQQTEGLTVPATLSRFGPLRHRWGRKCRLLCAFFFGVCRLALR